MDEELSYTDAMNKAVKLANERGAYGFFYQQHTNGYQIVGFYDSVDDMEGEKVAHGHKRGCVATLSNIKFDEVFEIEIPTIDRLVPESEIGYDEDPRIYIAPYLIDKSNNFILGGNYNQVVLANIGEELSYTDAMDKAVSLAIERGAYGFFYQQHTNGHQIAGFYISKDDMDGTKVWHGHHRGCIGVMADNY
jgi:hypothetical protein